MELAPHSVKSSAARDVAFRVLSDPHLFRLITQCKTGWPARVSCRWEEIKATSTVSDHPFLCDLRVRHFMRELLLRGDIETLRALDSCTWRRRGSQREPERLPVSDPDHAIRSGHAETVRWALEHCHREATGESRLLSGTASLTGMEPWLWEQAFNYFPGHCEVLDVMRELVPVSRQFWAHKHDCLRSVTAVQWIIDSYGVNALSPIIMEKAALYGNLPLVEFMTKVPGQNVRLVMARLDEYSPQVRAFLEETYGGYFTGMFKWGFLHDVTQDIASLFASVFDTRDGEEGNSSTE